MTAQPPRRHKVRDTTTGQFAAASPHHGAVQSTYQRAQVSKTSKMTPHQPAQITPQAAPVISAGSPGQDPDSPTDFGGSPASTI